jgi:hypothetical protein
VALPEVLHGKYLKKLTTIGNLATVIAERSSSNLAKLQSDSTTSNAVFESCKENFTIDFNGFRKILPEVMRL